jgi:hypothetical protein
MSFENDPDYYFFIQARMLLEVEFYDNLPEPACWLDGQIQRALLPKLKLFNLQVDHT